MKKLALNRRQTRENCIANVIIGNVADRRQIRTVDAPPRIASISFAPDGKSIAVSTGQKLIDIWAVAA